MKDALMQIKEAALEAIKAQDDLDKIDDLRVKYLGKKGELTAILKGMGKLSKEERPVIGELANTVRDAISQALEEKSEELRAKALEAKLAGETLDVTLPGTSMPQGHLHPLTQVVNDAKRIFTGLGFEVAEGPEIESDYYNFEALNLPPDHPRAICGHLLHQRQGGAAHPDLWRAGACDGKNERQAAGQDHRTRPCVSPRRRRDPQPDVPPDRRAPGR